MTQRLPIEHKEKIEGSGDGSFRHSLHAYVGKRRIATAIVRPQDGSIESSREVPRWKDRSALKKLLGEAKRRYQKEASLGDAFHLRLASKGLSDDAIVEACLVGARMAPEAAPELLKVAFGLGDAWNATTNGISSVFSGARGAFGSVNAGANIAVGKPLMAAHEGVAALKPPEIKPRAVESGNQFLAGGKFHNPSLDFTNADATKMNEGLSAPTATKGVNLENPTLEGHRGFNDAMHRNSMNYVHDLVHTPSSIFGGKKNYGNDSPVQQQWDKSTQMATDAASQQKAVADSGRKAPEHGMVDYALDSPWTHWGINEAATQASAAPLLNPVNKALTAARTGVNGAMQAAGKANTALGRTARGVGLGAHVAADWTANELATGGLNEVSHPLHEALAELKLPSSGVEAKNLAQDASLPTKMQDIDKAVEEGWGMLKNPSAPEDQKQAIGENVVKGLLFKRSIETGESAMEAFERIRQGGVSQEEVQQLIDEAKARDSRQPGQPTPPEEAANMWSSMPDPQKLLLWGGAALSGIGLLSSLGGGSGLGMILLALGLGGMGASQGMFGDVGNGLASFLGQKPQPAPGGAQPPPVDALNAGSTSAPPTPPTPAGGAGGASIKDQVIASAWAKMTDEEKQQAFQGFLPPEVKAQLDEARGTYQSVYQPMKNWLGEGAANTAANLFQGEMSTGNPILNKIRQAQQAGQVPQGLPPEELQKFTENYLAQSPG